MKVLAVFGFIVCSYGMHHAPVLELATYNAEEKFVADQILSRDFDKDIRPPGKPMPENPVSVAVSMYVMELDISPEQQELTVGGYFRQSWNDPRLKYDFGEDTPPGGRTVLKFRDMFADRRIWIPDTFVVGDKGSWIAKTPAETGGRSFCRVKCCGEVLASTKFRTEMICPMAKDATEAECTLAFESYFSTADDVTYSFKPDGLLVSDAAKQLLLNKGWELVSSVPEDSSFEIQGRKYSGVRVLFNLKRIAII